MPPKKNKKGNRRGNPAARAAQPRPRPAATPGTAPPRATPGASPGSPPAPSVPPGLTSARKTPLSPAPGQDLPAGLTSASNGRDRGAARLIPPITAPARSAPAATTTAPEPEAPPADPADLRRDGHRAAARDDPVDRFLVPEGVTRLGLPGHIGPAAGEADRRAERLARLTRIEPVGRGEQFLDRLRGPLGYVVRGVSGRRLGLGGRGGSGGGGGGRPGRSGDGRDEPGGASVAAVAGRRQPDGQVLAGRRAEGRLPGGGQARRDA